MSIISVDRVSKSFGAVQALDGVSFHVREGEIRALCGENGAGKSTLVKMLMGIVRPDAGEIRINDVPQVLRDPQHAQSLGMGLVAQELSLAPRLSVVDNIWLGSAEVPLFYRIKDLRARAAAALERLGAFDIDLDTQVLKLSIGQRQIVEIARLLARNARVLILDEPTATLSDAEIARLLRILRGLRDEGHAIIYVSHRLGEVFELCDSVTVLRNGMLVGTDPVSAMDREGLIERMLGRSMGEMYPPRGASGADGPLVDVKELRVPGRLAGVSFEAKPGQITCIAGQIGSGASLVNRALAGLEHDASGQIRISGQPLAPGSVPESVRRNVVFVSDDRAGEGLFHELTVLDNFIASELSRHSSCGILNWGALKSLAGRLAQIVGVDVQRLGSSAGTFSGGNQQKVLFGRAVARGQQGVLLMNEPTRGIDVGARSDIYRLMRSLCAKGYALVMTSSDLEEVVGLADVVYTIYRARMVGRHEGDEVEMSRILADITHPDHEVAA